MRILPQTIAESDRIPLGQKIAFAAGVNMEYIAAGLLTGVLWMPFFNIGLEMSPVVLGGILMVLRIWDAISDPVVGNLSDNTRTRWGRRRPYLLLASVTTALLFPLFWRMPGGLSETGQIIYLLVIGVLFFTSFTCWSMPYYGLQMELTPSYDERTRLTAWITLFGKLSALLGGWLLAMVIFTGNLALGDEETKMAVGGWASGFLDAVMPFLLWLGQPEAGEKPIVVGMRICSWFLALSIAIFGLLPALFVKERYYEAESSRQPREPFWKSVRESATCRPLWSLIAISFFLVLGSASVGGLGQYVNFYYVCGGDLAKGALIAGVKGTVIVAAGIATIPFFMWLGEVWDKKTVVATMLGCSMFGHLLNYFFMTPASPYLQIIPAVFESSAIAAVWLFLPSMKADVADWDERQTHRRREGSINAFFSWFIKASLTASMGIGGMVLAVSGFDAALDRQPDEVVLRMFWIYLLLPMVIWCGALVAVWAYPLDRGISGEIRRQLEERRGKI